MLSADPGLQGRRLQLHFENGWFIEYRFATARYLERTVLDAGLMRPGPESCRILYSALEVRRGVIQVTYMEPGPIASRASLVLDLAGRLCTIRVADPRTKVHVPLLVVRGAIDAPFVVPRGCDPPMPGGDASAGPTEKRGRDD